jgi:hypothetical protein
MTLCHQSLCLSNSAAYALNNSSIIHARVRIPHTKYRRVPTPGTLPTDSIQSSHGFVPEQRYVTNAFALPHGVNGDAQVDGVIARIGYARMASATNHSRH